MSLFKLMPDAVNSSIGKNIKQLIGDDYAFVVVIAPIETDENGVRGNCVVTDMDKESVIFILDSTSEMFKTGKGVTEDKHGLTKDVSGPH